MKEKAKRRSLMKIHRSIRFGHHRATVKTNRFFALLLAIASILSILNFGAVFSAFAQDQQNPGNETIKNIVVMIPDGGGFGNFDIAEALKLSGKTLPGLTTPVTTNAISGMNATGLYLSNFIIGTSKTYSANSSVTDSAAGGTAIATGYKTNNGVVSVTPGSKGKPVATLLEAGKLAGKSTGIVTTKYWFDATPASFASHATSRTDYNEISSQMLNQHPDVLLGGGNAASNDDKVLAKNLGYTVVSNKQQLMDAANSGQKKICGNFNSGKTSSIVMDYKNGTRPSHPTLLDMTKASIEILSKNIDNPNGFFLVIEGGLVDSGGHSSDALQTTSEYLAFDEAFAYVVEWAKNDGKTLVVGVPDHDTGGFTPKNEDAAIKAISDGTNPADVTWSGNGNHTAQNVPIWAYGPAEVLADLLSAMGLPDGGKEKARTGKYYEGIKFTPEYEVENTKLAQATALVSGLDLDAATNELFVDISEFGRYKNGVFTIKSSGVKIPGNSNHYILPDGTKIDFKYGVSVYVNKKFYVPKHIADLELISTPYVWINPFSDVSESDSFYSAVEFVNSNNLFMGTDKGFEPYTPMTRAMFVTVLGRIEEADITFFKKSTFPDVPNDAWYTGFVGWANKNKIVQGYDTGEFMPDLNVTREQMMVIVYNYAKYLGKTTDVIVRLNYDDKAEIHDWAEKAVGYCTARKLISPDENNNIRPTDPATRAEVAELLMNFVTKIMY